MSSHDVFKKLLFVSVLFSTQSDFHAMKRTHSDDTSSSSSSSGQKFYPGELRLPYEVLITNIMPPMVVKELALKLNKTTEEVYTFISTNSIGTDFGALTLLGVKDLIEIFDTWNGTLDDATVKKVQSWFEKQYISASEAIDKADPRIKDQLKAINARWLKFIDHLKNTWDCLENSDKEFIAKFLDPIIQQQIKTGAVNPISDLNKLNNTESIESLLLKSTLSSSYQAPSNPWPTLASSGSLKQEMLPNIVSAIESSSASDALKAIGISTAMECFTILEESQNIVKNEPTIFAEYLKNKTEAEFIDRGCRGSATQNPSFQMCVLASSEGKEDMIDWISSYGFTVNEQEPITGLTPLHCARSEANVTYLVTHFADVDAKDRKGNTPLHIASSNANHDCIKALLEAGASTNIINNNFDTALHCALNADRINLESILLLIEKEVSTSSNQQGETPLHIACKRLRDADGEDETNTIKTIIYLLIEAKKTQTNHVNENGYTPLHYACLAAQEEMARLLIDNGALKPNLLSPNQQFPIIEFIDDLIVQANNNPEIKAENLLKIKSMIMQASNSCSSSSSSSSSGFYNF